MIVTFVILIIGAITILISHKPNIVNPIEGIKKAFINTHFITIAILIAMSFIVNFISKTEKELIKKLIIVLLISVTTLMVFFAIKVNLDTTYTKNEFEKFYNEQKSTQVEDKNKKTKIDIGITGVSLKTEKQYYIDECVESYNIFKIKSSGTIILHLLFCLLLIFMIYKAQKTNIKKDKLNKDDLILFDDEENVKM